MDKDCKEPFLDGVSISTSPLKKTKFAIAALSNYIDGW
jgi:hypothetical protein